MDTTPPKLQQPHSHTQLYIVVGILIIIAVVLIFIAYPRSAPIELGRPEPEGYSTPLHLKKVAMTAEQLARQTLSLQDPELKETTTLTKQQQAVQAKNLSADIKPSM